MAELKAPQFNLIDEPWIPCLMLDRKQRDLNLREALISAHKVKEVFDPSPLVIAGLHRLLITVVNRCFPIHSLAEWKALWAEEAMNEQTLTGYLDKWRERFDLFHAEHPFYQQPGFTAKKTTPLKRLGWEFAAGNNATLFDHSVDEDRPLIESAIAARWIIATQCFAASAGRGESGQLHTKDSPMTRGAVILLQGNNLFETLTLNLLNLHRPDFSDLASDKPIWESNDAWKPEHNKTPNGKLEYLSWQSRSIRLLPEADGKVRECYFGQGRALMDEWCNEPLFAYKRDDKLGLIAWKFDEGRAVWRDSHALFNLSSDAPFQVPQGLRHLATLTREGFLGAHKMYQLQVLGQSLESGAKAAHGATAPFQVLTGGYAQKFDPTSGWQIKLSLAMLVLKYLQFTSSGGRTELVWKCDIRLGCKALRLKGSEADRLHYVQLGKLGVLISRIKSAPISLIVASAVAITARRSPRISSRWRIRKAIAATSAIARRTVLSRTPPDIRLRSRNTSCAC